MQPIARALFYLKEKVSSGSVTHIIFVTIFTIQICCLIS